jgi:hypothetical protein
VYDVTGRKVATLAEGARPTGPGSARWEGRDRAGRRVAAGVYLLRLELDGRPTTEKIAVVR